jgi:hypothetical protein
MQPFVELSMPYFKTRNKPTLQFLLHAMMPLVVGFKDGHPVNEPLPERPPTKRQFTRPNESPIVDLDAALSAPNWNGVSDMGLFGKLPPELRDRIYGNALVATLNAVDAKIQELVEENGAVSMPARKPSLLLSFN